MYVFVLEKFLKTMKLKTLMFFLKKDFVIVAIDKAANDVIFICKHFYVSTIIKEVNYDCR